jgi:hypothetical protein
MLRRTVYVVALVTGTLAAGALPALTLPATAAPTGGCPSPSNRPVLSIGGSPSTIIAGASSTAFGKFTENGCAIGNAAVVLRHRAFVNGKASGTWRRVTVVTTTSKGVWSVKYAPAHNQQLQAVFWGTGRYARTYSTMLTLRVRDRLSIAARNFGSCKELVSGQTSPVKANRRVFVQSRGPAGHFKGWTTMFESRTNAQGRYSIAVPLTCGSTYNLAVYIAHDATNLAGRSRTLFGLKPVR